MRKKAISIIKQFSFTLLIFIVGNTNSYAAPIDIAQIPLFLGSGVQPNVFFLLDDSGSMDWEILTRRHWSYTAYDPDIAKHGTHFNRYDSSDFPDAFRTDGSFFAYGNNDYRRFVFMYASDNAYTIRCGNNGAQTMEACNQNHAAPLPDDYDWRYRASSLNVTFYNPSVDYKPWNGPCGSAGEACVDADFRAARDNPKTCGSCSNGTRDMSVNGDSKGGPFTYDVWIDDSGFTGIRPRRGDNTNETGVAAGAAAAPNGLMDLWDSHVKISVDSGSVAIRKVSYDPHTAAQGSEGINETTVNLGAGSVSTGGVCYDILGAQADVKAAYTLDSLTAVNGPNCRTIAEAQTNIANWYSYSRRRMFGAKNAMTAVIDAQPAFRYGITKFRNQNLFTSVPIQSVSDVSTHNFNLKNDLYSDDQEAIGTDLLNGLSTVGDYFKGGSSEGSDPIYYSCQKNFQIVFTDGYWNDSLTFADVDGDGISATASDVAYSFFKNDLSVLPDEVIPDKGTEAELDPDGDNRTWQHLVSFTVAFGILGNMVDSDGDGWPEADANGVLWPGDGSPVKSGNWGDPSGTISIPAKVDDLWHVAWNTNGTFAAASSPEEVVEKLITAIKNIRDRAGSAAAVALNSGTLNANSRVYQASFDSTKWSGQIRAVPIQDGPVDELPKDGVDDSPAECSGFPALGELCSEEWEASAKLATRDATTRNIYTFSSDTYTGIEFKDLTNLGVAQQTALKTNPNTPFAVESNVIGQLRLNYIRGDNSNEGVSASEFRERQILGAGINKLGDIVHSAPAFVGKPNFFYPNNLESASYNAFKSTYKNRDGVVYVGANDGMLHAFDASNNTSKGDEIFAYIPGKLVNKLPRLTAQNYNQNHTYFVDGSPVVFDAFNGAWKTLLSGSVGAGGQLVYGLDVTNPGSFNGSDILWEFTDEPRVSGTRVFGDIDLGYTVGEVSFARMNGGKWAVIFGNGFNNTEADGNPSLTGNAAIYVVDAFTGELIKKFDTQVGTTEDPTGNSRPNGISKVTPVDLNGDFKVDYLYAADLFGNVWKMDVTSSSPGSWDAASTALGKPKPFFIAKDSSGNVQSITSGLSVKRHPEFIEQAIVLFGTGSYFQSTDPVDIQTQTFYAIWDDNTAAQYARNKLLEQKILNVQTVIGLDGVDREFRVTSSGDIDPANYKIDWTQHKGWFMDLPEAGERVGVEPILRGNRIIFVTLTPLTDPCSAGGSSWIMEVNADSGSRLKESPFDVNGDGIIDDLDIVAFAGDSETLVSGVRSKEGILSSPGILNTRTDNKELKLFNGSTNNMETITESVNEGQRDRQTWRQYR